MPVTTGLFYLFFLPFVIRKGKKFSLSGWLSFIPIVLLSAGCGIFTDGPWKVYAVITLLVLQSLQLVKLGGASANPYYSFSNGFKALGSIFVTPFMAIPSAFKSLGGKSGKKGFASIGKTVLGVAIALPAVIILILLFSSADEIFKYYTQEIIKFLRIDWGGLIFDIIMGFIISLYLFPMIFGLRIGYNEEKTSASSFKGLDAIVLSSFIFVCDIVYIAFVAVQFTYLFSPGKKLPTGTTYAEYGRNGFFQLVAIIIITFTFIAVIINTVRKNQSGSIPLGVKLSLSVLTISNIIIVCSAVYRMGMYLEAYGLTRSRVIACWFIAVICLVLLGVIVKIWFNKIKICSYVGVVITAMVILLNVMNVDALIARVNISRYLDHGKDLDFFYLSSAKLSPAVVPEIERLFEEGTEDDIFKAKIILSSYYDDVDNFGGEINYQDYVAQGILKDRKTVKYTDEALTSYLEKLLCCPYDYCHTCHSYGNYFLCRSAGKAYCPECGEEMCAFCMEHKTYCKKEREEYASYDGYCKDCDMYSYSYGSKHCYCEGCGKQLV